MAGTTEAKWKKYRRQYLPEQLERARLKVKHLEAEARRLGMFELLEPPDPPADEASGEDTPPTG